MSEIVRIGNSVTLERKSGAVDRLETKAALTVDDAGEITGTAWPFGSPDRAGDMIEKGAFSIPARLPMLFAHDQGQAIGVWDSIEETSAGLQVKGRLLVNDVERAREVRALVREGAVTGLSIGFVTRKAVARKGGGRTISALDLHEISIVPVPSHMAARVISVKAAGAAASEGSDMENENAAPDLSALETKMGELADTVKGIGALTGRLDKIEARLNRPAVNDNASGDADLERKAFVEFARKGIERMEQKAVAALTVSTDSQGGYLAPEAFGNEILKKLVEHSPIRAYARVMSIASAEIKLPRAGSAGRPKIPGAPRQPRSSTPTKGASTC
jgi:HK97 family phage prohead protease